MLVDVRTVKERKVSIIKNAITKEQLEINLNYYKSKKILVYCTIGERSSIYAYQLKAKGITTVANLRGGVLKWAHAGGVFVDSQGNETKKVNVYAKAWNFLPVGYIGIW